MDVLSAMQWWEEWQLRVLVLGSLFIQFFLAFAGRMRAMPKLRMFLWLGYIGSDAVAIYALATLFSRQKKLTVDAGSSSLEVIWAPVLLIHLGQNTMSAYSLEDNELWRRHVFTLMTQVTVALYVFCKWWSGGERLLASAVLLFIVGIIKFAQKPWILRRASFASQQAASSVSRPRKAGIVSALWRFCTTQYSEAEAAKNKGWRKGQKHESLQKFVEEASKSALAPEAEAADHKQMYDEMASAIGHTNYFVDVIAPYSAGLKELKAFMKLASLRGNLTIDWYIRTRFLALYANVRTFGSPLALLLHFFLLPSMALASLVLFARSHKDGYSVHDIRVTYIVFCWAAVQELIPWLFTPVLLFYQNLPKCMGTTNGGMVMVPQYNLLSYCARKKKPSILMKLATFSFLRELVGKYGCIEEVDSTHNIVWLVFSYVKLGWKQYIQGDAARYKRFNNFRGQMTLSLLGLMERIGWSVSTRFDESILMWHIATDLCFSYPNTSVTSPQAVSYAKMSKDISNYMMYLFFISPEMLIPGTRPALFSIASEHIELLLKDSTVPLDKEENLAREILKAKKRKDTPIDDACKLAEALMELEEGKRWALIQNMWVEMLCYSVSRCRGYLQAKSLGQGVGFSSWVWVMWSFMGMETWVERYHRLEEYPDLGGGGGSGGEGAHVMASNSMSQGGAAEGRGAEEGGDERASSYRSQGGADEGEEGRGAEEGGAERASVRGQIGRAHV